MISKWLKAVPLLLVLFSSTAIAQPAFQLVGRDIFGTWYAVKATSTGGLSISEESKDRDQYWVYTDVISRGTATALKIGQADSSAMLPTRGWKYMGLWVYGLPAASNADSLTYALLRVQVRGGGFAINDSLGAHPWAHFNGDTIGTLSTDQLVSGGDTTGVVPKSLYIPVVLTVDPALQSSGGRGMFFPLMDKTIPGAWWSSPYTSILVTYVKGYSATRVAVPNSATWISLRCDLIGWR